MQTILPFNPTTQLESIRERLAARFGAIKVEVDQARKCTFVVDDHALRILKRLGFIGMRADSKTTHDAVIAAADDLASGDLLELQWHMKNLGQTICTSAKAMCASCPLSDICKYGVENLTVLNTFRDKQAMAGTSNHTPIGHAEADLCLNGGLQHGVLHEVFAVIGHETAATGFVAGLASRVAADRHSLWIRQDFSTHEFGELSPTGLLELGLDPARLLLLSVSNANDGLRAANDALSCNALGAVVIEIPGSPKILDLTASRRLTLAATQKSVTAFLLRFAAPPQASTAETRWLVRAGISQTLKGEWGRPTFEASLIRNRHGNTGHWLMEWNCDGRIFQSSTADYGAVVSAVAN